MQQDSKVVVISEIILQCNIIQGRFSIISVSILYFVMSLMWACVGSYPLHVNLSVLEMRRNKFYVKKKFPQVAYFEYFIAGLLINVFY